MRKIYICRHGQTRFNVEGRAQGWKDSPLTMAGKMQALSLKHFFNDQNVHFKTVYTSDLGRALETAGILADPDSQIYASMGLREISFGDLDGADRSELAKVNWETDYEAHNGESYEEAIIRAYRTLLVILAQDEGTSPLLIVTHGAILAGLYQLFDKPASFPEEPDLYNCQTLICTNEGNQIRLIDMYHPECA